MAHLIQKIFARHQAPSAILCTLLVVALRHVTVIILNKP